MSVIPNAMEHRLEAHKGIVYTQAIGTKLWIHAMQFVIQLCAADPDHNVKKLKGVFCFYILCPHINKLLDNIFFYIRVCRSGQLM